MNNLLKLLIVLPSVVLFSISTSNFARASADFREVEKILGFPGQMDEGAFGVRFPRSDVKVTSEGSNRLKAVASAALSLIRMNPAFAAAQRKTRVPNVRDATMPRLRA